VPKDVSENGRTLLVLRLWSYATWIPFVHRDEWGTTLHFLWLSISFGRTWHG